MDLKESFEYYETKNPSQHNSILKTSLALRRGRIHTIEELRLLYEDHPEEIEELRGIGPQRFKLIGEILEFYKTNTIPAPAE